MTQILLVDDDPDTITLLGRILGGFGDLRFATCGEDALRLARDSVPDLVLLDAGMTGMSGFEVCAAFKGDPRLSEAMVIFVTSNTDSAFEVAGFEMGAADFVTKPVNVDLLQARVKTQLRVKGMADELRRIATVDGLTGVANRRRFDESLEREWALAGRSGRPLSLLMVDVDDFKLYNDQYGHLAGDDCLRSVALALTNASQRPSDLVARYGGDEFVVLLPETPEVGGEYVARAALDAIDALEMPHRGSSTARGLTISVGVACWEAATMPSRSSKDLIRAADQALYAAKHMGRGQARLRELGNLDSPELADAISPRNPASRAPGSG